VLEHLTAGAGRREGRVLKNPTAAVAFSASAVGPPRRVRCFSASAVGPPRRVRCFSASPQFHPVARLDLALQLADDALGAPHRRDER
jgi:hypothetical protein